MREHKYKAKCLDGQWVEGYYWQNYCGNHFIRVIFDCDQITVQDYEIDPNTLCEFTGLFDENKNEVYENDILNINDNYYQITYGEWNCGCCYDIYGWIANFSAFCDEKNHSWNCNEKNNVVGKVVGNIFDNPELLEAK